MAEARPLSSLVYPDEDLVVIALGGNALLRRGEEPTEEVQRKNAEVAAQAIAKVIKAGYRVCVTHGNGPQVGMLALKMPEVKLDVLDAQTEGAIGYLLEAELNNALNNEKTVVTLLTQVVVNEKDPAFKNPTKFIGPQYDDDKAKELREMGYTLKSDGGKLRRVVASPEPYDIIESEAIRILVNNQVVVVCTGGGGIPVVLRENRYFGVDAVVDKDIASRVLACLVGAKYLLLLTDADGVYRPEDFGKPGAHPLSHVAADDLMDAMETFPSGSMRPKVQAAVEFASFTIEGVCGIGQLEDALEILEGKKGTIVEATEAKGSL
mmetsp:Transcript_9770/g.29701  ORF Transcript_9770/g.29701 Transcript_9770/m.29701 type:complete len:322 (+) Transcript_9770:189-1154(+)|eukprot:CAMPEP_0198722360 /NCGR_PEP_ID=MMETSP1475-20131203/121_1 /TAXON_ID= ORGANISM="Unidentified sp., Strain CCMP1999" /NCGR_SAMPLE_ID=MMETSP1475 /ASSEMBLY_ACC=CAM_ASM_001111 /LENGTH=321 /DNA_ID=CAMNT_0044483265 /DNA_START=106 /DNA_END=1071 /DNA_ORIENTATION=-